MKFKKITLLGVMAVLCLNFGVKAQEITPAIGEKLPDILLDNILNHPKTSARLTDFKGKVIILDFWATWCSNCIRGFAHLDTLQKKYNKHLQVLLVNNSSRDDLFKITTFLERYKTDMPGFLLPIVVGNDATKSLYYTGSLPHYIWIGYDRKVKAITGTKEVNDENVARFVAGLPLVLPVKEAGHE
ncbi:MAG: TlpA family protein disulfide reductase [Sphingobacteriales bacterium]|nr:MAG: TlpA family protein disulfide reductase [Sphingobacteriales bacterium]